MALESWNLGSEYLADNGQRGGTSSGAGWLQGMWSTPCLESLQWAEVPAACVLGMVTKSSSCAANKSRKWEGCSEKAAVENGKENKIGRLEELAR